jgi:hypothetical protein
MFSSTFALGAVNWPAPQTDNVAPAFSWDTMGSMVFMQLCNQKATLDDPAYPPAVMKTLAKYPLVTFEKCEGTSTPGYEEDKVIASCSALKEINPGLSCVHYLNTELDFTGYRLFDDFEHHSEFWLLLKNGSAVHQGAPSFGCKNHKCPPEGLKLPDYSVVDAAAFWMIGCANITAHPSVDGCNLDRASHVGDFTGLPDGAWAPRNGRQAYNDGKLAAMQKLQKVVGDGPVIANCHECLTDKATIPGVHSQNVEFFRPGEKSIQQLQVLARHDKLAKAHYSEPETSGDGCFKLSVIEPALATFLIGAGKNAFFSCAYGWTGIDSQGTILPWVAWLPQYDYPLGDPLALGEKHNGVWRRNFSSGTAVWFHPPTNSAQICWSGKGQHGGPCPLFPHDGPSPPGPSPPTPSPPGPSPPSPPAPSSCGVIKADTGVGGSGSDMQLSKTVASAADCCAWCKSHAPKCVMWAWHHESKNNQCHLHTSGGVFTHKDGCYSAQLNTLNSSSI